MSSETSPSPIPPHVNANERWKFLRDVAVFQLKLFIDNVRDFALVPISLVAAVIDLIFKGERQGALLRPLSCPQCFSEVVARSRREASVLPAGTLTGAPALRAV